MRVLTLCVMSVQMSAGKALLLPPSSLSELDSTREEYSGKMEQLQKLIVQVNTSLFSMRDSIGGQQLSAQRKLDTVEASVNTLQNRVSDFESHPPTIGEVRGIPVLWLHCYLLVS